MKTANDQSNEERQVYRKTLLKQKSLTPFSNKVEKSKLTSWHKPKPSTEFSISIYGIFQWLILLQSNISSKIPCWKANLARPLIEEIAWT